jgi:hypothetical protein
MATKPAKICLTDTFTPTQWDTAETKLKFANHLLNFIAADFPEAKFTQQFYNRLSMTFGHIAHYVEGVIMRSVDAKNRVRAQFRRHLTPHNPHAAMRALW